MRAKHEIKIIYRARKHPLYILYITVVVIETLNTKLTFATIINDKVKRELIFLIHNLFKF